MSSEKSSNRFPSVSRPAFSQTLIRWLRRVLRPRPARELPLLGGTVRAFQDRLTARGRYLFLAVCLFAVLGLDTRAGQVYVLFSIGAGMYVAATIFGFRPAPRAALQSRLPSRATAGRSLRFGVDVTTDAGDDLYLSWIPPRGAPAPIDIVPRETFLQVDRGRAQAIFDLAPARRGRYVVPGPRLRRVDPFGLLATAAVLVPDHVLLVYPRFYTMEEFAIPLGRRYQPGGIPLTSSTGDAIEFIGTRDYRPGDAVRNIHWRSWARRGEPVVKEYQEEYFCRIAVILDTFMAPGPSAAELASFETAISVVASIADYFSRSEYIVDILAAGPDVYEVSAGRGLAYLDNILDVLSCVDACHEPPFETIGPQLFERLAGMTTVVAVLQDWDPVREAFLRRVRATGAAVRAVILHDGPTTTDWNRAADEFDGVEVLSSEHVERAMANHGRSSNHVAAR